MAEVNTDVQPSQMADLGSIVDEDLIDYEDEAIEQPKTDERPDPLDEDDSHKVTSLEDLAQDEIADTSQNQISMGVESDELLLEQLGEEGDPIIDATDVKDGIDSSHNEEMAIEEEAHVPVDNGDHQPAEEQARSPGGSQGMGSDKNDHGKEQGVGLDYEESEQDENLLTMSNDRAKEEMPDVDEGSAAQPSATDAPGTDDKGNEEEAGDDDEITWEEGDVATAATSATAENLTQDAQADELDLTGTELDAHEPNVDDTALDGEDVASTTVDPVADEVTSEYPSITVHYKDDEFPFFAHSSEGFFADTSVLDDNMETVLAGFRSELGNEIASEEELVFQIDEMGLEYAESSSRDLLTNVTLRQILEIFDLLVKNQDPDSSRVLYTYLFTKSSTLKRFESLAESAAAGLGLDEVIQLFQPPHLQADESAGFASAPDDYEDIEGYDSTGEASAEAVADEAKGEDDNDHPSNPEQLVTTQVFRADDAQFSEQPNLPPDEDRHDLDSPAPSGEGLVADGNHQVQSNAETDEAHDGFDATLDNESHGAADDGDFDVNEGLEHAPNPEPQADDLAMEEADFDAQLGNDLTGQPQADDGGTHESPQNRKDEHADFAEIDWREDPIDDDRLSNGSPNASKRPRAEDEPGFEDMNDVKRHKTEA